MVRGLSAVGAGLYSIGIPEDSIVEYETHIKAGKLIVDGSAEEVNKTRVALAKTPHQGLKEQYFGG